MSIFNDAWSENWGFVPLTERELAKMASDLKLILMPELTRIVSIEGEAAGVAIDLGGNDSYACRTAAHLGAAWDESLGVFHDAAGDDSYRTDGLAVGAAAQQAFGIALDRAGRDQYRAFGGAVLGASSDNEYHFDATGLGSVALFLDLAGLDLYPAVRQNDAVQASADAAAARLSGQDSVFLDERSATAP